MNIKKISSLITILIALIGIQIILIPGHTVHVGIEVVLVFITFFLFFKGSRTISKINFENKNLLFIYLFYELFIVLYSFLVAQSYEQWRYVFTVFIPTLALPFVAIISSDRLAISYIIKNLFLFALPCSLILYFSDQNGMSDFTHYVSFIYFFIILIPYVPHKWKLIICIVSIITFTYDLNVRSNLLNILVCVSLVLAYYTLKKTGFLFKFIRVFLLVTPIVLFSLGITNTFNVFQFMEENESWTIESVGQNSLSLSTDSRTGVYVDALKELTNGGKWLWGGSAADQHQTALKDLDNDYFLSLKNGRMGSEVGILCYLLYGGILYAIIIFLIFYQSTKLAIYRSNNKLIQLIGVYLAFRWFFLFIEGEPAYNLGNFSLFMFIGICFSPKFRQMNDKEIRSYFYFVFKQISFSKL